MRKIALMSNKGSGIVGAVLIMLIMGVMGATMASLSGDNSQSAVNYFQSQQAFFLGESGVQRAMYELSKGGGNWTGWSGTDPKTIQLTLTGYGDYDISVASPNSSTPSITATGYVPSRTAANKAVRVVNPTATNTSFFGNYAGFAAGSAGGSTYAVSMSGQAFSDSYDSSNGLYNVNGNKGSDGNIGTNADITTSGQAKIKGDATTGTLGTFNNQSAVTGTIAHNSNVALPSVVVPTLLVSCTSGCTNGGSINLSGQGTQTIPSGNYQYSSISASGQAVLTIVGPTNFYITGSSSINVSGQARISISPSSTGPVIIYFAGGLSLSGQGIDNTSFFPSNLQLYGASGSTQNISMTGQGAYYGVVYAPHGNLTLSGQGGFYGSYIGDVIGMSGQGAIHHDENLANLSTPSFMPSGWKIANWKEVF